MFIGNEEIVYIYCRPCGDWRNHSISGRMANVVTAICDRCKNGRVLAKSQVEYLDRVGRSKQR